MNNSNTSFQIGSQQVGRNTRAFLIAEVGLAHEGSLGTARAFVDAAVEVGVDAVKFQTHLADAESTDRERFRVPTFPQDATRQDYWRRTAFTPVQWQDLSKYVREQGLIFLSSPFSEEAVDLLMECNVPAWKIASGEVSNLPLLEKVADTGLPVIVSSGLSSWAELDQATSFLSAAGSPFAVFQCTSAYPCPPESWGLNLLEEMRERYSCPVGLSDHSGTLAPSLASVSLGADMLEFHITLSPHMFGPDVSSSLTIEQAQELVRSVRQLELAFASPVDKDAAAEDKAAMRQLFTKSIVAAEDLPLGTILKREHLAFKKPGDGIPASEYQALLGRRTLASLARNQQLHSAHFKHE